MLCGKIIWRLLSVDWVDFDVQCWSFSRGECRVVAADKRFLKIFYHECSEQIKYWDIIFVFVRNYFVKTFTGKNNYKWQKQISVLKAKSTIKLSCFEIILASANISINDSLFEDKMPNKYTSFLSVINS